MKQQNEIENISLQSIKFWQSELGERRLKAAYVSVSYDTLFTAADFDLSQSYIAMLIFLFCFANLAKSEKSIRLAEI